MALEWRCDSTYHLMMNKRYRIGRAYFFLMGILSALFAVTGTDARATSCLDTAMKGIDRRSSTARSFDFFEGHWTVSMQQRKIDRELHPSSHWVRFPATVSVRRVLEGAGFEEDYTLIKPRGSKYAIGTRLYDPRKNQWAIYWANKDDGQWQPPAIGGFKTAAGFTVIYDDTWASRPILTRYEWTTRDPNHPSWVQSLSGNCGATWISNWIMQFSRLKRR